MEVPCILLRCRHYQSVIIKQKRSVLRRTQIMLGVDDFSMPSDASLQSASDKPLLLKRKEGICRGAPACVRALPGRMRTPYQLDGMAWTAARCLRPSVCFTQLGWAGLGRAGVVLPDESHKKYFASLGASDLLLRLHASVKSCPGSVLFDFIFSLVSLI